MQASAPFQKFIWRITNQRIKIFLRNNGTYWNWNNRAIRRISMSWVSPLQHGVIANIWGMLLSKTGSTKHCFSGPPTLHGITSSYRFPIVWYYLWHRFLNSFSKNTCPPLFTIYSTDRVTRILWEWILYARCFLHYFCCYFWRKKKSTEKHKKL